MDQLQKKAKAAVAERANAIEPFSSSHQAALKGLVRLLARQAATELVAKRKQDKNQ